MKWVEDQNDIPISIIPFQAKDETDGTNLKETNMIDEDADDKTKNLGCNVKEYRMCSILTSLKITKIW